MVTKGNPDASTCRPGVLDSGVLRVALQSSALASMCASQGASCVERAFGSHPYASPSAFLSTLVFLIAWS